MRRTLPLPQRWIRYLRERRAELLAERAWRNALRAETFTDWDSLENRRHFALFPWDQVAECREDLVLQASQDPAAARGRLGDRARPCFGCGRPAWEQEWIFYQSALWTWSQGCGRAGWIAYCPACDNQVSFHRTRMS